jgi:hypothetical protein
VCRLHLAGLQHVAHSTALLARPLLGGALRPGSIDCGALSCVALIWFQRPAPEFLWHLLLARPCCCLLRPLGLTMTILCYLCMIWQTWAFLGHSLKGSGTVWGQMWGPPPHLPCFNILLLALKR